MANNEISKIEPSDVREESVGREEEFFGRERKPSEVRYWRIGPLHVYATTSTVGAARRTN